ncbi:uncharacterized protein PgNI_12152 [Pyricularia grisea]|uniref:Uncharacterized protein n=1 Tax=Pyricularia grisea TaxID=148305 RepID=A0A6P8AQC0_PYRGI|nr:uncharacterized protein PgNI_12152 [Pyricularia grisea]TLD04234.1 hypothetical protein PgNI_12152 [Pyricularia grisea]
MPDPRNANPTTPVVKKGINVTLVVALQPAGKPAKKPNSSGGIVSGLQFCPRRHGRPGRGHEGHPWDSLPPAPTTRTTHNALGNVRNVTKVDAGRKSDRPMERIIYAVASDSIWGRNAQITRSRHLDRRVWGVAVLVTDVARRRRAAGPWGMRRSAGETSCYCLAMVYIVSKHRVEF